MTEGKKYIGLTGTNSAGKGEAAAFFMDHGFSYYSLSDIIREELRIEGLSETRDHMIRKGNELRERFGPDILARRIMAKAADRAVIDSIRNPQEIHYLRRSPEFLLLAVDAPIEIRYERAVKRGRDESARTLQEFAAKEQEEMGNSETSQQLFKCLEMSDVVIVNDGSLESFHQQLEKYL